MLGVVLVFAAIQLAVGTFCFCRARGGSAEKVIAGLAGVAAIGLGLISTFMSAALALQALAIVVLGLVGLALRIRLKSYLIASTVATIILFAVIGSWNFSENRELRQQYPFESLAQRLAYETESQRNTSLPMTAIENIATTEAEPNGAAALKYEMAPSYERIDVASHQSAVAANPTVAAAFYRLALWETALDRSGSRWQSAMRTAALRNLHASQVEQFVNSPGFGVGRMRRPTKYDLKLRPPYPMPMQSHADKNSKRTTASAANDAKFSPQKLPQEEHGQLDVLHRAAQLDFVNRPGFGYVRDREHVGGFVSHRNSRIPSGRNPLAFPASRANQLAEARRARRLSLGSASRHERAG